MLIGNFHNGQSLSRSEQDKLFTMKNVEVFADLGNAQCQYALVSDSTTPNEDCILLVVPSGDVYHFSTESGKIWKQTGGVYSLVNTNGNGSHNGCIYYTEGFSTLLVQNLGTLTCHRPGQTLGRHFLSLLPGDQ